MKLARWSVGRMPFLMIAAAVFQAPVSSAQTVLTADEVKATIAGNTAEAQRPNGSRFLAYYEPGGLWLRWERGIVTEGKWRVMDNGDQCVTVGKEDSCAQVQKNGDGTYTRMQNGKPQFNWLKVMPGKGF
ncbi:MAG: hypothetical protein AB7S86_05200 [Hydrogenophaga sp.]|uniref:hypothetical protein n=1 Tax=Hydrogenophaga sp. TaxID=1904254 RepID=UPI003D0CCE58